MLLLIDFLYFEFLKTRYHCIVLALPSTWILNDDCNLPGGSFGAISAVLVIGPDLTLQTSTRILTWTYRLPRICDAATIGRSIWLRWNCPMSRTMQDALLHRLPDLLWESLSSDVRDRWRGHICWPQEIDMRRARHSTALQTDTASYYLLYSCPGHSTDRFASATYTF